MSVARENYKKIIDDIFGIGVCTIDTSIDNKNNVIGALVSDQYTTFTTNFLYRLRRLSKIYSENEHLRDSIQQAVNQVADINNWDGAFSELTVLDYFFSFPDTGAEHLKLDVTIPAAETLASEMGFCNANLDGHFSNFDFYFDTKVLSDKSGQIVDGITRQVKKRLDIPGLTIHPSFNGDLPFEEFQKNRNKLLNELLNGIHQKSKTSYIKSTIVESLSYRLLWGAGVSSGESEYSPIQHAKNHHTLLFQHVKKFHRNKPTVIVFVNFPWFGEKIPPLDDVKESFYSNLSKNFFNGYSGKKILGRDINGKIKSGILASDVTKHLSAIIFMDDHSILGDCNEKNHIKARSYLNNEAKNDFSEAGFISFLKLNTEILRNTNRTPMSHAP
ncbi:hypothetical protein ACJJIR_15410 [Microbulbifer sp. SSSA008]|uniref:hypothetical protein n=1 Tax=Microbulbifer sp. SSSA008 TaxID=3243380 RepID=UPI0040397D16